MTCPLAVLGDEFELLVPVLLALMLLVLELLVTLDEEEEALDDCIELLVPGTLLPLEVVGLFTICAFVVLGDRVGMLVPPEEVVGLLDDSTELLVLKLALPEVVVLLDDGAELVPGVVLPLDVVGLFTTCAFVGLGDAVGLLMLLVEVEVLLGVGVGPLADVCRLLEDMVELLVLLAEVVELLTICPFELNSEEVGLLVPLVEVKGLLADSVELLVLPAEVVGLLTACPLELNGEEVGLLLVYGNEDVVVTKAEIELEEDTEETVEVVEDVGLTIADEGLELKVGETLPWTLLDGEPDRLCEGVKLEVDVGKLLLCRLLEDVLVGEAKDRVVDDDERLEVDEGDALAWRVLDDAPDTVGRVEDEAVEVGVPGVVLVVPSLNSVAPHTEELDTPGSNDDSR